MTISCGALTRTEVGPRQNWPTRLLRGCRDTTSNTNRRTVERVKAWQRRNRRNIRNVRTAACRANTTATAECTSQWMGYISAGVVHCPQCGSTLTTYPRWQFTIVSPTARAHQTDAAIRVARKHLTRTTKHSVNMMCEIQPAGVR